MAIPLKQSTASQEVLLGPFLDATDGVTAETALTIANTDIKLWKAGGTTEASKNSGGATHIASGRYYAVLDATDTDTLGPMEINVAVSGALPVRRECWVLPANVYDSLFGSDLFQVDVTQFGGTNATTSGGRPEVNTTHLAGTAYASADLSATMKASVNAEADTALSDVGLTSTVTGRIDVATSTRLASASYTAPDGAATIADAVWDEARSGHVTAGTYGEGVASVQGDVTGAVASVTGAVGSVTGNVGGSVASVTGDVGGNVTGSVGSVVGDVGGDVVGSVASVTAGVTVTTNNDKTGYSIASGGIGSGAHAAAELNAMADALLDRNMATGTDSGTNSTATRTVRQALRRLRNKESIAAGTGTIYKEDDSTTSWTYAATTTAGDPLSAVDPT